MLLLLRSSFVLHFEKTLLDLATVEEKRLGASVSPEEVIFESRLLTEVSKFTSFSFSEP
jgi:hypothetical protein